MLQPARDRQVHPGQPGNPVLRRQEAQAGRAEEDQPGQLSQFDSERQRASERRPQHDAERTEQVRQATASFRLLLKRTVCCFASF